MDVAPEVLLALGLIPAAVANVLSIGCFVKLISLMASTRARA